MSRRIKVRIVDHKGRTTRVSVELPKKYRRNRRRDWRGLADAYLDGVADGIAAGYTAP